MMKQCKKNDDLANFMSLDFIVIGSGRVVDKYWLPSQVDGSVKITGIVSIEPEKSFRKRAPEFIGKYYHSMSADNTLTILASLAKKTRNLNVANVATSDVRLFFTQKILVDNIFDTTRLFLEKPYATNFRDIESFADLSKHYYSRLHFSRKYANGRSDILNSVLPVRSPVKITGRLIEGTEYFDVIKDKVDKGYYQYLLDGPELDLGFHLLDVICSVFQRSSGLKKIQVKEVYDLSRQTDSFEPNYGFGAILKACLCDGSEICIDLQAGKGNVQNQRFIEFDYGDVAFRQEYTVRDSQDPVFRIESGVKSAITQHGKRYNYYAKELHPNFFCKQTHCQQLNSLFMNKICLDIKTRRLAHSLVSRPYA